MACLYRLSPNQMFSDFSLTPPNRLLFATTSSPVSCSGCPKQNIFQSSIFLSFAATIAIMDRFTSVERLSSPHSFVPQAGAGDVESVSLASTDQAALADTPLKARVSSYDGDHKSYMKGHTTCRDIGPIFWKEIHTGLQAPHPTLGEHIFPPSVFTLSSDLSFSDVVSKMSDVYSRKWLIKVDARESRYAAWLNAIGESFSKVTQIPVLRRWKADSCNTLSSALALQRAPFAA